jgi:hypothetical protein
MPASDIDTAVVDSLKALDPKRPIREADMSGTCIDFALGPIPAIRVLFNSRDLP